MKKVLLILPLLLLAVICCSSSAQETGNVLHFPTAADVSRRSTSSNSTATTGTGHAEDSHGETPYIILFIFATLGCGAATRHMLGHTGLPYTVLMMLFGIGFGFIAKHSKDVERYTSMTNMDPNLILIVFLPGLIFESAMAMDLHIFLKTAKQILIFAGPGLLIATSLTAVVARYCFDYDWDWNTSLLFGAIVSATDPVAVVALLNDLGVSKRLSTVIEGESLLNDGTAIVLFTVLLDAVKEGTIKPAGEVTLTFIRMAVGGPIFGGVVGLLTAWWLGHVFNDAAVELTITLSSTYITFYIAEDVLHISGVLAVVMLGLVTNRMRTRISPEVEKFLHRFWHMIAYLANTLIFGLVGVIISLKAFDDIGGKDWGYLFLLYIFITLIRTLVVVMFHRLVNRVGYAIPWQNEAVIIWGGLRGAVGLALALLVASEDEIDSDKIGNKVLFLCSGIVILTLTVNATTIGRLLSFLKLDTITKAQEKMIDYAIDIIKDEHMKAIQVLKSDRVLCDANWPLVAEGCYLISNHQAKRLREMEAKRLLSRLHRKASSIAPAMIKSTPDDDESVGEESVDVVDEEAYGTPAELKKGESEKNVGKSHNTINNNSDTVDVASEPQRPSGARASTLMPNPLNMSVFLAEMDAAAVIDEEEVRLRFLKAEKRSLWKQFEEGLLGRDAVRLLIDEINEVMDTPNKMITTEDLERFWAIPKFFVYLSRYPVFRSLSNYMINTTLSIGYDIGIGFIIGQEEVEKLLDYMTDDDSIIRDIQEKSSETRLQVIKSLAILRKNYPEVAMSVKTHQSIRSVLNSGRRAINELHEDGVLDEAEASKLLEMIELKMQNLIYAPPTLSVPTEESVLRNIQWLRNCQPETVDALVAAAEQRVFEKDNYLVKIGEPSDGLYIIISGLVKITAGPWRDYGGPGMIIGELGVLMSTPRGADVSCQMVVRSVFLNAKVINEYMAKDSKLEYNLWKTAGVRIAYNKLVQMEPFNQWGTGRLRRFVEKSWLWKFQEGESTVLSSENTYIVLTGDAQFPQTQQVYSNNTYIPTHVQSVEFLSETRILNIGEKEFPSSSEEDEEFANDSNNNSTNTNNNNSITVNNSTEPEPQTMPPQSMGQGGGYLKTTEPVMRTKLSRVEKNNSSTGLPPRGSHVSPSEDTDNSKKHQ
eukprot:Nk52_evm1s2612 gene=Nk52_evmTU1s2612